MAALERDVTNAAAKWNQLVGMLATTVQWLQETKGRERLSVDRAQEVAQLAEQIWTLATDAPTEMGGPRSGETLRREEKLDLIWQWEAERAALADSLRAGAGQLLANTIAELAACRRLLESLPPEEVLPGLQALEQELRQEFADFQSLIWDLSAPLSMLSELGLYACLRLYIKGCARKNGVRIRLEHDAEPLHLSPKLQVVVYRLVQMAVRQAQARQGAEEIVVTLARDGDTLTIRVADDGAGDQADTKAPLPSIFLDVQELADLLNAKVMTEILPGRGRVVSYRMPLPTADA